MTGKSFDPSRSVRPPSGRNRELALLLLLTGAVVATGIGLRSPWPADEPRFALIALEMVETGDWLFPHRGGELYPDKPPVFIWMQAVFYLLTGSINLAFLLPSLIASLIVVATVYDLGRRFFDATAARNGCLLLLCTVQFMLQAKTAQIDMTVCMWITLGNYGLMRHLLQGPAWGWFFLAWIAMGLGVITKGVGFLPVLMLLPYAWVRFKRGGALGRNAAALAAHLAGPVLMLSVVAAWIVPMVLVVNGSDDPALAAYRDNILLRQTAERYVLSLGHRKPFFYYLVQVIPPLWLPLSFLLPWLLGRWYRQIRSGNAPVLLALGWAGLVLLFFSFSPGKRGVYILPILPMLAVISGPWVGELVGKRAVQIAGWLFAPVVGTALVATALVAFGWENARFVTQVARIGVYPWHFAWVMGTVLIACGLCFKVNRGHISFMVAMLLLWSGYATWGYRLLEPARSPRSMMAEVAAIIGPDAELAIVNFKEQMLLHAGRPVVHFGFHGNREHQVRAAAQWLAAAAPQRRWVLLADHQARWCFDPDRWQVLGYRHRKLWVLVAADAIAGDSHCLQPPVNMPRYLAPAVWPRRAG